MQWWEVARPQAGVISHAQLRRCGVSASTVARMTASGELTRLSRGVHVLGGAPLTWQARLWAAVLATDGVLGSFTAGRLWGVRDDPADGDAVHVVVPGDRHVVAPQGVRLRRHDLLAGQTRIRSGLPVLDRRGTVVALLRELPFTQATRLADRALQRGWIERSTCTAALTREPRIRGNPQLRRIAAQLADGAAAESERVLHRLLRRAGIRGWTPNQEVWHAGELLGVVDVAFPLHRLAVEVDGMAYHVDVDRFRRDRSRQNGLVALGWTVLRFTWADLTERPGYVIASIRAMLTRSAVG
ncbi:Very-short-patch-repair endonuclease [Jatrophihabitans endophyticus]|uniref:Very-short-patch-repair endonuclease n=1 Tax=Jatrophihabitans endophyticus TaxID=1206085 RepID=A0A1M5GC85_9ACTN|nr:AbiEi antitoxin N-terminal domain-containing protein [Jatrophihabitans endophyticus]SHG01288.1 Very-short-patch-repair endonuclease [Jatrophihabitans endophyticus]